MVLPAVAAADSEKTGNDEQDDFVYGRGKNWKEENIHTLISWLHTSAIMLDLTREATTYYRKVMRRSTIINLVFSSVAGTVSLSQFNTGDTNSTTYSVIETLLKAFFSAASILVALNTGYIKVYQIQERLEGTIQLQQQWSHFGSLITSELQLPTPLRKDALQIINKMKETYHQLIRDHVDINRNILEKVALRNGVSPQQLTITDLFERVIAEELNRIKAENGDEESVIEFIDTDDDGTSVYEQDLPKAKARAKSAQAQPTLAAAAAANPSLKRSSTNLFESKNTKKLLNLDKKVMNTRTQIANIVLNPRKPTSKNAYDGVMNELKNKKQDSSYQTAVAIVKKKEAEETDSESASTLSFDYDNDGNPEIKARSSKN
jgi:hypothetical protein